MGTSRDLNPRKTGVCEYLERPFDHRLRASVSFIIRDIVGLYHSKGEVINAS